jgi:hypothetical protein
MSARFDFFAQHHLMYIFVEDRRQFRFGHVLNLQRTRTDDQKTETLYRDGGGRILTDLFRKPARAQFIVVVSGQRRVFAATLVFQILLFSRVRYHTWALPLSLPLSFICGCRPDRRAIRAQNIYQYIFGQ